MSASAAHLPAPSRRRRLAKWLAVTLGLGGLVLLAMPVWWPWVLIPVLERQGVSVGGYQREGISRLDLRQVGYTNTAVAASAESLVLQLPHGWLLDRLGWSDSEGAAQVGLSNWRVELQATAGAAGPSSTNSLAAILDQIEPALRTVRPWLRRAGAWDGELVFASRTTRVERITLLRDSISVTASDPAVPAPVELTARFPRPRYYEVGAAMPGREASLDLQLFKTGGPWSLSGELTWQTNFASLSAETAPGGWLPATFGITATNWVVPARLVGLEGFRELAGGFGLTWTNGNYRFDVHGQAAPASPHPLAPEGIQVDLAGHGTPAALTIERLNLATPALRASLSDPLAMDFTGRLLVPAATLRISAEVGEDAGLPFTGQLEGTVTARPAMDEYVNAGFDVQVNRFGSELVNLDRVDLDGALHWPQLVISNGSFALPGGQVQLRGEVDLLSRALTNANWSFTGSIPTNLLPAGLTIESINATGSAAGSWPDLEHRTDLVLKRTDWRGSRADELAGTLSGRLTGTNAWHVRIGHGELTLNCDGMVDLGRIRSGGVSGSIDTLNLAPNADSRLRLAQPATWETTWSTKGNPLFAAQLSPLRLTGSAKLLKVSADLQWPSAGNLAVTATNITSADLAGLWAAQLPEVAVRELLLTAGWDNGPLNYSAVADFTWSQPVTGTLDARARLKGGATGATLSPITLSAEGREIIAFEGSLPMQVTPHAGPVIRWLDEGVFDLRLRAATDGRHWDLLQERTGISFTSPQVSVAASGNLGTFRAELAFAAAAVRSLQYTNLPPEVGTFSNLQFAASLDRFGLSVAGGRFEVAGQPANFAVRLPLTGATWSERLAGLRTPDLSRVTGELALPTIEVAAVAPLLGGMLVPTGRAAVELRKTTTNGVGGINGFLTFTNLSLQPVGPLGAVRELNGRIELKDQEAELKSFSARLSGQPVRAGGKAAWDARGLTRADVFLQATNVSLVRSVDLFLRGDLDLRITADQTGPPKISGDVHLSDSLLFQDIGSLVKIDLKQPAKRPPFFSVPDAPLGDWQLDVRVRGQRFLRVLSPVFKGKVSTGLQLGGTLREPVALGEISIEQGQMLFPFGTLDVTRGVVQLSRQDPHLPRVDFRGQGLNFGYNITVDVNGNVETPNVTFSSVPPLTTREIMLMLTAGEVPSGAYSYTDVDKASKLGYFLGKELINQVLGLDSGEDKLLFRTGEYVTDDGQLTYRIEYKLIDWLSVFGEYTRFRDYNGGLKFNVYSR